MLQALQNHLGEICLVLLVLSEALPFSDAVKGNGIFHAVVTAIKGPAKAEADKISKE